MYQSCIHSASSPYLRSGKTKSVTLTALREEWVLGISRETIVSLLLVRRMDSGPRRVPYYRSDQLRQNSNGGIYDCLQKTSNGCYLNLTSDQLMCWPMTAPKLHCAPSRGWHALPYHFNPGQARFTPPDVTHSTKAIGRGAKGGKYLVKEVLWTFLKYRRVYSRCETPMPPDAIFLSKTV